MSHQSPRSNPLFDLMSQVEFAYRISTNDCVDALQRTGAISDLVVTADQIAEADLTKAMAFLRRYNPDKYDMRHATA